MFLLNILSLSVTYFVFIAAGNVNFNKFLLSAAELFIISLRTWDYLLNDIISTGRHRTGQFIAGHIQIFLCLFKKHVNVERGQDKTSKVFVHHHTQFDILIFLSWLFQLATQIVCQFVSCSNYKIQKEIDCWWYLYLSTSKTYDQLLVI